MTALADVLLVATGCEPAPALPPVVCGAHQAAGHTAPARSAKSAVAETALQGDLA